MSTLRNVKLLACTTCATQIEVERDEAFNYIEDGSGPYCDQCFFFVERILALEERIKRVEYDVERERLLSLEPGSFT
jgi:hypothetical protein